jgi:hypothetical protein
MKEQAAGDVLLLFACLREKGMAKPATMMLGGSERASYGGYEQALADAVLVGLKFCIRDN